jgi:hypothetical protein
VKFFSTFLDLFTILFYTEKGKNCSVQKQKKGEGIAIMKGKCWTALGLILPLLSSCALITKEYEIQDSSANKEQETTSFTTSSATSTTERPVVSTVQKPVGIDPASALIGLTDADYQGTIFVITSLEGSENLLLPEGSSSYATAAQSRLSLIEKKYNIQVVKQTTTAENLLTTLRENNTKSDFTSDLLFLPASLCSTLAEEGLLLELRSAAFFDEELSYYQALLTTDGQSAYAVRGDACEDPADRFCIFYNTSLAQKAGLNDLASLSLSEGWTWEAFSELAKNGGFSSDCSLSYTVSATFLPYEDLYSADGSLKELSEETSAAISDLLTSLEESFLPTTEETSGLESFAAGESLFLIAPLSAAEKLSSMQDSWSLLPLPSLNGKEEANAVYDPASEPIFLAVPLHCYTNERSVQVLSAFCAATCSEIRIAAWEKYSELTRLNEARLMLTYILDLD